MTLPRELRPGRAAAAGLGLAAGTAGLGLIATGWYCANELLVPQRAGDPYRLRVLALDPFAVTLPATEDTLQPGDATLEWIGGYGFLGPVPAETDLGARRALTERTGTELTPGTRVRIKRHAFNGTPAKAFGLAYTDIEVHADLGPMPAWLVPGAPGNGSPPAGRGGTWAILVHGRGHGRIGMLRLLPEFHRAGLTSLVISYRNDVAAPASPDGLYHLGDTEWFDLEAAVSEARRRGADRIVLAGDSMGAAVVLQFVQRSRLADGVAALIFDAPVLDWTATLALAAEVRRLPRALAAVAREIARRRISIEWDRFDQVQRATELRLPMLIVHGQSDTTVPLATSQAIARRRPDLVTLVPVPGAEHAESWKVDPAGCAKAVRGFLGRLGVGSSAPAGAASPSAEPPAS